MTVKQLQTKLETLVRNDPYCRDAQVTFKTGINGVEYAARNIGMAKSNSGIVVARIN